MLSKILSNESFSRLIIKNNNIVPAYVDIKLIHKKIRTLRAMCYVTLFTKFSLSGCSFWNEPIFYYKYMSFLGHHMLCMFVLEHTYAFVYMYVCSSDHIIVFYLNVVRTRSCLIDVNQYFLWMRHHTTCKAKYSDDYNSNCLWLEICIWEACNKIYFCNDLFNGCNTKSITCYFRIFNTKQGTVL